MLALANMMHFFSDEFAGLCRSRLALLFVSPSAFYGLLFRHNSFHSEGETTRVPHTTSVETVVASPQ
jgi:hypothetical protein